ncbi:chemotaxis protein CheW [Caminibacter sp.]
MKVPALKFRVADKYFAVEMEKIKHFFDVEDILHLPSLPSFVVGIVRYNNYVYPLISLKKAWGIEEEDSTTAVAMVYEDREYAILIDEIIKIDELEKKENFLIEVFEENGEIIGNLSLDFLKNVEIPTFKNILKKEESKIFEERESFLLFRCKEEILGVDTKILRKVEEYDGKDVFLLNNTVITLLPFSKIYKESPLENILILEKNKILGIVVDEIIDIALVEKSEIVNGSGMFNRYFVYNNKEVKIFNNEYLEMKLEKYGVVLPKEQKRVFSDIVEVLVLDIAGEKFAVKMSNILEIVDFDEAYFNFANENPHVKGILTTKEGATFILSLEKVLGKEIEITEDSKIIVFKNGVLKALLVSGIEDLIYVEKEKIVYSQNDTYIGGIVIYNDSMIPLFNLHWPKDF